jgi:hypothetical protein
MMVVISTERATIIVTITTTHFLDYNFSSSAFSYSRPRQTDLQMKRILDSFFLSAVTATFRHSEWRGWQACVTHSIRTYTDQIVVGY